MKNIIKQVIILSLFLSFTSCIPDDQSIDYSTSGGNTALTTTSITRLDKNYALPIKITTKSGVQTTKVEVYYNTDSSNATIVLGAKIADAAISADGTSASFNTASLSDFEHFGADKKATTGSFAVVLVSTFSDGSVITNPYTLTIGKGISWYTIDKDGKDVLTATSGVPEIKYNSTLSNLIRYKVAKKTTTVVDNVVMQWKKNKAGTYAATTTTFPTTKGSFDLGTVDYTAYNLAVGDSLYVKFVVTAGTQVDFVETAIKIIN